MRACPDGQAVQALEAGGKVANCIAVPAPVDLGAVNARIDAEAIARMQGDQAVRDSIDEKSIVGTYASTGTRSCVQSSTGFVQTGPTNWSVFFDPNNPPNFSNTWTTSRGFYTFNADGTGSATADVITISTAGASVTTVSGPVTWSIDGDGKLTVTGDLSNPTIRTEDPAPLTGHLGKDVKVLNISQEGVHVETLVQIRLIGGVPTEVHTPRICNRQTVLIKRSN